MNNNELVAWLPIGISFIALLLSGWQFFCERMRCRKEATIHAFDQLETSTDVLFLFKQNKEDVDSLVKIKEADKDAQSDEWESLSKALPLIEHFAVGINSKIYDKATLNRMAGNQIISTYLACEELIKYKRTGWGKGKNYAEFEKMAKDLLCYRKRHGQSTP